MGAHACPLMKPVDVFPLKPFFHVHSTYRYGTLAALTRATMLLCALAQVFILMTAATRPNGAPLELMLAQSFAKNVSEGVGRQGS